MLVWINGAHGAGKTSVAARLTKLLPGSAVIDPEQIGFMLRRTWPGSIPGDFKALPIWRELCLATLRAAATGSPGTTLIVPMTLSDRHHFAQIVGGLRGAGVEVRHFTLVASVGTLRRRLRWRLDWPSSRRWALCRAERTAAELEDQAFAAHVQSDGRSVPALAEEIARRSGAEL